MNGYELSRLWFDFCFENPEKIKPTHTALYFFIIEHCNRLGWKPKFGLPTDLAKETIGIKSYNTYINTLNDLVDWGFLTMIEKSKNQYSSNIIALSKFDKALDKAFDKALINHVTKQSESICQSTCQSIDSIDKQINNKPLTIEPINIFIEKEQKEKILNFEISEFENIIPAKILEEEKEKSSAKKEKDFMAELLQNISWCEVICMQNKIQPNQIQQQLNNFEIFLKSTLKTHRTVKDYAEHFVNWINRQSITLEKSKSYGKPTFSTNR